MLAALHGTYVQFVVFMGVNDEYPKWFKEEISNRVYINESRYCFWTPPPERYSDYYEKQLIETYSIVVRKYTGETHVMEIDTFKDLYEVFSYNKSVNGGIAAFKEDCIEYVGCVGGNILDTYPQWFYQYFTECLNHPNEHETYLFDVDGNGCIIISERCVFLRNRFNEVRQMLYKDFLKYYDPRLLADHWWEDPPPF